IEIKTDQGPCTPLPSTSFGTCLASLVSPVTGIQQLRETRTMKGFYLDWGWQTAVPFLSKVQYQLQAQGDWFPFTAGGDNSSDTRYRYDMNNTLKIPIFASFS